MVWAKIDDAILDNPKIARVGVYGFALHVAAVTWCCRNLTDGFIPSARVTALLTLEKVMFDVANPLALVGEPESMAGDTGLSALTIAEALVDAGLWDRAPGGFQLHDFLEYNPSREEVLAKREKISARVKRHRSRVSNDDCNAVTNAVSNAPVTPLPDPDPVTKKEEERDARAQEHAPAPPTTAKRSKRKTQAPTELPEDWEPSESCLADFRARGFDALGCLGRFRHYWTEGKGAGTKRADWTLTYWNWAEREAKDGRLPLVVTPPAPPPSREPEPEYVPPPPEFAIEMAKALAAMPKARSWEDA